VSCGCYACGARVVVVCRARLQLWVGNLHGLPAVTSKFESNGSCAVALSGCSVWLLCLVAVSGCFVWLLRLAAVPGCCVWLLCLAAVSGLGRGNR